MKRQRVKNRRGPSKRFLAEAAYALCGVDQSIAATARLTRGKSRETQLARLRTLRRRLQRRLCAAYAL